MIDKEKLIKVKLLVDEKVIRETLSRIGIANKKTKTLWPSCYLYRDNGDYYVIHFKEYFLIMREDSYNNLSNKDIERRNAIVYCLYNWKLIDVDIDDIKPFNEKVFVLPHEQKREWSIKHKINLQRGEI